MYPTRPNGQPMLQQPQQQGPQQPAQAQPSWYEPLIQRLTDEAMAQNPQPPTPPGFTGLDGPSAYGAVLNPHLAPSIIGAAQAPAQARYAQQQQAFEQAMGQQSDSRGHLVSLMNSQTRAAGVNRPRSRSAIIEVDGVRKTVNLIIGTNGEISGIEEVGTTPWAPVIMPGMDESGPGILRIPKTPGGQATRVTGAGGGALSPMPPAGIVSDVAGAQATIAGVDDMMQGYRDIRAKTQDQSNAEKMGRNFVGSSRYGGAFEGTRDYAEYVVRRRASLNAYIKSITGAQFSVKEMEAYDAMYPEPWDDEALASQKAESLKQRSLNDMRAKLRVYPAAAGASGAPSNVDSQLEQYEREYGATP